MNIQTISLSMRPNMVNTIITNNGILPDLALISCNIKGLLVTMPDPLGRKSLMKK